MGEHPRFVRRHGDQGLGLDQGARKCRAPALGLQGTAQGADDFSCSGEGTASQRPWIGLQAGRRPDRSSGIGEPHRLEEVERAVTDLLRLARSHAEATGHYINQIFLGDTADCFVSCPVIVSESTAALTAAFWDNQLLVGTADMRREAAVRVVDNVRRLRVRLSAPRPIFAAPPHVHHAQHRRKYRRVSEWGERR